jgi:hypothetical protein
VTREYKIELPVEPVPVPASALDFTI